MNPKVPAQLGSIHGSDHKKAERRRDYADRMQMVCAADLIARLDLSLQKRLWDGTAAAAIGTGKSVTLDRADSDESLVIELLEARHRAAI